MPPLFDGHPPGTDIKQSQPKHVDDDDFWTQCPVDDELHRLTPM
jgi:hypothetical protein